MEISQLSVDNGRVVGLDAIVHQLAAIVIDTDVENGVEVAQPAFGSRFGRIPNGQQIVAGDDVHFVSVNCVVNGQTGNNQRLAFSGRNLSQNGTFARQQRHNSDPLRVQQTERLPVGFSRENQFNGSVVDVQKI